MVRGGHCIMATQVATSHPASVIGRPGHVINYPFNNNKPACVRAYNLEMRGGSVCLFKNTLLGFCNQCFLNAGVRNILTDRTNL